MGVLNKSAAVGRGKSGKVLDSATTQAMEQGVGFRELLRRLLQGKKGPEAPNVDAIVETTTPAGKLANWSLIFLCSSLLSVSIDEERRLLILAGDLECISSLLSQFRQNYLQGAKPHRPRVAQDGSLFIESIYVSRPLEEADSCLEFLLLSFCQHFRITPKQAAGLLTQGNKYLAQILGKGLKTDFQPVRNWYKDLKRCAKTLIELILKESQSGSLTLVLSALRPGLLSRSEAVILDACALFTAIVPQLTLNSDQCWTWFAAQPGGIDACFSAIQKFGSVVIRGVAEVLHEAARFRYRDLLVLHLRAQSSSIPEYFHTLSELLPHLATLPQGSDRLIEEGVLVELTDTALREADSDVKRTPTSRISALTFLAVLWKAVPRFFEEQEEVVNSVLALFKKACRDKSSILNYLSTGHLFTLLTDLYAQRSVYAPLIFKSLTFLLIETYNSTSMREYLIGNFIVTLEEIESLPVAALVEPVVKQVNLVKGELSLGEFEFFVALARHQRLQIENAVMMADVCGKQYFAQLHLSKAAIIPLLLLSKRFISSEIMQEFAYRLCKLGLSVLVQAEKEKKPKPKVMPQYNNRPVVIGGPLSADELFEESCNSYRQKLVVDLLSKMIQLDSDPLNSRIKETCVSTVMELKRTKFDYHKGLMKVLGLLGNAADMLGGRENVTDLAIKPRPSPMRLAQLAEPVFRSPTVPPKLTPQPPSKADLDKKKVSMERQKKIMKSVWEMKLESSRSGEPPAISHPLITHQMDIIKVKDLDCSEDDLESLQVALKMYSKLLKHLFRSYSGSAYAKGPGDIDTFDHKGAKKAFIREAELIKLLKDHNIPNSLVTKDHFSSLLRSFCVKKQANETTAVEFPLFPDFLVQLSLHMYSKPPHDLSYLPPAASFLSLISLLRLAWKSKGKSLLLFDSPHLVRGDKDILMQLNEQISRKPNMELPEGYRKVVSREVELTYELQEETGLREGVRVALGVVDGVVQDVFGVHILEPRLISRTVTRVEAVGFKPTSPSLPSGETRPALQIPLHRNPTLKVEVIKMQKKYGKDDLQEVVKLIDDLISSVENGFEVRRSSGGRIQNRIQYQRELREKQILQERERAEQKRLQRIQEVEELLTKANEAKRKKARREKHRKKREDRKKEDVEKVLMDRKRIEAEEKARLLMEWMNKKQTDEQSRRQAEWAKQQEMEAAQKAQRQEYMKKAEARLTQIIQQKTLAHHQEILRQQEEAKVLESKRETDKKKAVELLEVERQRREAEKQMKRDFAALAENREIAEVVEMFSRAVAVLHDNYAKVGAKEPRNAHLLQWAGLNKFCLQFFLLPELISAEELTVLYRMYTKDKTCEDRAVIGMTGAEFADCLVRIAALGQSKLRNAPGEAYAYGLADCNAHTVRALFTYMQLPEDPKRVLDLLKDINTQPPLHPRDRKRISKGKRHIDRLLSLHPLSF